MIYKRYDSPINLILLLSFVSQSISSYFASLDAFRVSPRRTYWYALSEFHLTLSVVIQFDAALILQALVITAAIVIGLTAYTFQTKRDFSSWGTYLGVFLIALFIGGLTNVQLFRAPASFHLKTPC